MASRITTRIWRTKEYCKRICLECENEFIVYNNNKKAVTCSVKCGQRLRRKRERKPKKINIRLTYCHKHDECLLYSDCYGKNYNGNCYTPPPRTSGTQSISNVCSINL